MSKHKGDYTLLSFAQTARETWAAVTPLGVELLRPIKQTLYLQQGLAG